MLRLEGADWIRAVTLSQHPSKAPLKGITSPPYTWLYVEREYTGGVALFYDFFHFGYQYSEVLKYTDVLKYKQKILSFFFAHVPQTLACQIRLI